MGETAKRAPEEAKAAPPGFSTSAESPPLPRVFGRLLLLKLLARGGMGDVYLAATTGIEGAERPVIVKTVRRDHIHDGSFLARFLDEARVQAQLCHPGVAQVLEASTDENGEPFTVVEYVEGRSLADVRQRSIQLGCRIGWPEAVALSIEMAQALAHVHERSGADGTPLGIVHRDLSPQNVMVGYSGELKLIDFGTARGQNRRCHTVAGVVFAKPGYVAPEVARQQVGDGRIDVYALGIMLWELSKGARYLTGDPHKHLEEAAAGRTTIPAIAESVGAPPLLDEIIKRLTANEPDDRYASASLAAVDLAKLLAHAPNSKSGERGVRARIAMLMRTLWPHEPSRSRAEFARHLRDARGLVGEGQTPNGGKAAAVALAHMVDDPSMLSGTPYRLARKIGEGASGAVYEAEHVELGRKVAIKVLETVNSSAKDSVDRFRREARTVARLTHPNLVHLYDFGKALDGRVFLAMELLLGETLDRRIKRTGGMDWREAVELGIQACCALEAAHNAGLVHRDLKPANLFLTEGGGLKLLDFGVAMALADVVTEAKEKRQKGFAIFGTPEYMAPEQVAGDAVDGRCDLYALGCVLYELTTGTRVFEGGSAVVTMGKQLREHPDPVRTRAPMRGIPEEVDQVIMRALSKQAAERFATAAEMRKALEQSLHRPLRRARVRRRVVAGVMTGASLLLVIAAGSRWAGTVRAAWDEAEGRLASTADVDASAPIPTVPVETLPQAPEPASTPEVLALASNAPSIAAPPPASTSTSTSTSTPTSTSTSTPASSSALTAASTPTSSSPSHPEHSRDLAEAREAARDAMSDARALRAWTLAALHAGELHEARRAADAWVLHDDSPEPRLVLATVLDASGRRADARAVLEEVLQMHPDSAEARRLHARLGVPLPPADTAAHKGQVARR